MLINQPSSVIASAFLQKNKISCFNSPCSYLENGYAQHLPCREAQLVLGPLTIKITSTIIYISGLIDSCICLLKFYGDDLMGISINKFLGASARISFS